MSVDENKALVQRLYDDLFNRGYPAAAAELVSAGFVDHEAPPGTPCGPEAARLAAARLRAAFPDGRHVIEDLIGEDDTVVARLTFGGTHQGPYHGVAPTGRRVTQAQLHILRIAAGQVAEHWAIRDDLGLLTQLGLTPLPEPTSQHKQKEGKQSHGTIP